MVRRRPCDQCGVTEVLRKHRCEACYRYLRRTGKERPLRLAHEAYFRRNPIVRRFLEFGA